MNDVLNDLRYFDKNGFQLEFILKLISICQIQDILFLITMSGILRYSHFLNGILNQSCIFQELHYFLYFTVLSH